MHIELVQPSPSFDYINCNFRIVVVASDGNHVDFCIYSMWKVRFTHFIKFGSMARKWQLLYFLNMHLYIKLVSIAPSREINLKLRFICDHSHANSFDQVLLS